MTKEENLKLDGLTGVLTEDLIDELKIRFDVFVCGGMTRKTRKRMEFHIEFPIPDLALNKKDRSDTYNDLCKILTELKDEVDTKYYDEENGD